MSKTILHFGEMLWDQFPDYKRPGGSPFNVAMHLHYLKHQSFLISAVGRDDRGSELLDILSRKEASKKFIQRSDYPTGTVSVQMDQENEPSYTIHKRVAWDFIEPPAELYKISPGVDAFTFATLSQRSSTNRITLQKIFSKLPDTCLHFFDVNLRSPFISKPVIEFSLKKTHYVKMNSNEWDEVGVMLNIESEPDLIEKFNLHGLVLTLGRDGAVYFDKDRSHFIETAVDIPSRTGDLVGVGDAFWACYIHHTLKQTSWQVALKKANQYAGWVASQKGGIPDPNDDVIKSVL